MKFGLSTQHKHSEAHWNHVRMYCLVMLVVVEVVAVALRKVPCCMQHGLQGKVPPILTNDNRQNTAFYKLSLVAVAMYNWLTLKSPCKIESMLSDRC